MPLPLPKAVAAAGSALVLSALIAAPAGAVSDATYTLAAAQEAAQAPAVCAAPSEPGAADVENLAHDLCLLINDGLPGKGRAFRPTNLNFHGWSAQRCVYLRYSEASADDAPVPEAGSRWELDASNRFPPAGVDPCRDDRDVGADPMPPGGPKLRNGRELRALAVRAEDLFRQRMQGADLRELVVFGDVYNLRSPYERPRTALVRLELRKGVWELRGHRYLTPAAKQASTVILAQSTSSSEWFIDYAIKNNEVGADRLIRAWKAYDIGGSVYVETKLRTCDKPFIQEAKVYFQENPPNRNICQCAFDPATEHCD
ncbi:hypothetical protein P2H44_22295 [Albimonas sp. CAU 1670]|uniref:hypothetical protein n=1 Tax=Albimonas sp. CAU 1670 TaxID=3032599 RepID=UPI0023DC1694|nr:hypothetical protein [Albimonas sp. CAU 1670]MDF2235298.1 hypothetical protein [Albimonas sp. CAU 1670]